jgi:hypothetical protein
MTQCQGPGVLNHHDIIYTYAINDSFVHVMKHFIVAVSINQFRSIVKNTIKKILHYGALIQYLLL